MKDPGNERLSYWIDTVPAPEIQAPRLTQDTKADVAIIGGGIAGLTTAYLLANAGQDVVLLERDQLALAETQEPGRFFGRCGVMPLGVDAQGYTRVDRAAGHPVTVCLEPKRNEFMSHFIAQLSAK